jgi:hypothetical protein
MRRYLEYYRAAMKVAILQQLQYRVANYFYLVGMVAEPVIYLVVWSTVAAAEGGEVGGYTAADFAAYYIVGTLVHNMNIVLSPYSWEWRVKVAIGAPGAHDADAGLGTTGGLVPALPVDVLLSGRNSGRRAIPGAVAVGPEYAGAMDRDRADRR